MTEEHEYILGTDRDELRRLELQHEVWLADARTIWAGLMTPLDPKLEAFLSDDISGKIHSSDVSGDPPETFVDAVKNHDRYRFRADVIVKW